VIAKIILAALCSILVAAAAFGFGVMLWLLVYEGPRNGWLTERFLFWEHVSFPCAVGSLLLLRLLLFVRL
jgi:hypothetical protein